MNTFERTDSVFIQQGSSQTLRVLDENRWYVVKEEWEGSRLLNSVILSSYKTEAEATNARDTHKAAAALGKLGGASRSNAKRKASAENGKKGGRPKKQ